jgi:hypothetical protein
LKLRPWKARRSRVRADAADLIASHGHLASAVAARMARDERNGRVINVVLPRGHWERVRMVVRRSTER